MQNIKYLIYIVFSFLLVSCGGDFFDSITEVEIPEHEPQLVVRANFDATFSQQYAYQLELNHTLGILDTAAYKEVENATVTLLEDGILKRTFEKWTGNDYGGDPMTLLPEKEYTLKATSPIYGSIEATQQLPSKVTIMDATYEADVAVDRYGERGDEITIQFQDPAGEQNYYQIGILLTIPFEGPDTSFVLDKIEIYADPVDPLLEHLDQLYLTDASFDGETYTTRVSMELIEAGRFNFENATNLVAEKITVRLISISKDRYLFEKTLSAYRDNQGNPFAEPVVVHENIEGGSGIFTLSVTDEFSIDL